MTAPIGHKTPTGKRWKPFEWKYLQHGEDPLGVLSCQGYELAERHLIVVSTVEEFGIGPEWHVSLSKKGRKFAPSLLEVLIVERAFGMQGASRDEWRGVVHLRLEVGLMKVNAPKLS